MADKEAPTNLQEAVDRSFQVQWGGKRFCLISAVVFFVLAVLSAVILIFAADWFRPSDAVLKVVEISALATSFVCLIAAVQFAVQVMVRAQREKGQLPDRNIHAALSLSLVTVAGILFSLFMYALKWEARGVQPKLAGIIMFIIFLFSGLAWLGSVVMNSAAITLLVTRRTDMLEVTNNTEGTSLTFKRGSSGDIVKLCISSLISFIIFLISLLMAGSPFL